MTEHFHDSDRDDSVGNTGHDHAHADRGREVHGRDDASRRWRFDDAVSAARHLGAVGG